MIPSIVLFTVKFTVCISILVIFYKTVLSRLTFFNSIRWYFILGILCSVLVSMVSIKLNAPMPESKAITLKIADRIPSLTRYTEKKTEMIQSLTVDYRKAFAYAWCIGILLFMGRFGSQFFSLFKLRRKATRLSHQSLKIYLIKEKVSPFSFLDAIYLHPHTLSAPDYEKILAHEWIHISQRHSIDMILAEIVCILNWFNPFAWIMKQSIRQNLEFLTDDIMLSNGADAKDYQHLLL